MMDFESGQVTDEELIDSGLVWKLQGMYGRTAKSLIDQGLCKG